MQWGWWWTNGTLQPWCCRAWWKGKGNILRASMHWQDGLAYRSGWPNFIANAIIDALAGWLGISVRLTKLHCKRTLAGWLGISVRLTKLHCKRNHRCIGRLAWHIGQADQTSLQTLSRHKLQKLPNIGFWTLVPCMAQDTGQSIMRQRRATYFQARWQAGCFKQ